MATSAPEPQIQPDSVSQTEHIQTAHLGEEEKMDCLRGDGEGEADFEAGPEEAPVDLNETVVTVVDLDSKQQIESLTGKVMELQEMHLKFMEEAEREK